MEIAVISDLHLGPGGAVDGFGHDDTEFVRFLAFLEGNFERIVLLGDIWETLTGSLPGDPAAELLAARLAHPEIARRFSSARYRYIHGNHDLVAGAVLGVPDEVAIVADGVRLLFTHGHQGDSLVSRRRWLSELGIWLGGWIRRLGLAPLHRLLSTADAWRAGSSEDSTRCAFQREWVGQATRRGVDIVVTGHTHIAARAEHGNRLYLNSGSCSDGKLSYLAIDTKRSSYTVHTGF
ncbi:MAG TPA: UDP-2,3-diacylglucosamine diphosphatase [Polyangiaceae bacterium]